MGVDQGVVKDKSDGSMDLGGLCGASGPRNHLIGLISADGLQESFEERLPTLDPSKRERRHDRGQAT